MRFGLAATVVLFGAFVKGSDDNSLKCGFYEDKFYQPQYPYDGEPYIGQFPWFGVVYRRSSNNSLKFACGGTLISEKHVVTTRICALREDGTLLSSEDTFVRLGTHEYEYDKFVINELFYQKKLRDQQLSDRKRHNFTMTRSEIMAAVIERNVYIGNAQYRHVVKIHQPVEFDKASKNELIILELSRKVEFNRYVQPICVQTQDRPVRPVTVLGWRAVGGGDPHLGEFKRKTTKCPYSHLKTKTYYNQAGICLKDRGSIGISNYKRYFRRWYIVGLIDCTSPPFVPCEREPNLKTVAMIQFSAYTQWITSVANLAYLKGEELDRQLIRYQGIKHNQKFKFQCGHRTVNNPEEGINGYQIDSYPGQWPWYGTVYHRKASGVLKFACGGTLISEKYVLTARVCVTNKYGYLLQNKDTFVRFGTHSQRFYNFGFAQHRTVSRIHEPATFDENSANKLVILELNEGVKFNDYVQPVCIKAQFLNNIRYFSKLYIGWGAAGVNEQFSTKRCTNVLNHWYANHTDICSKDRGSINIYLHDDGWNVDGFIDCTEPSPDPCDIASISDIMIEDKQHRLIDINAYEPWIRHVTKLDYLQKITKGQRFDPSKKYPQLLPRLSCGLSFTTHNTSDPKTQLYEHPWMARIGWKENNNTWVNKHTGSLISHRYVLTDTYLAKEYAYANFELFVRLGEHNYRTNPDCDEQGCAPPARDYEVESVVAHQDHNICCETGKKYVALIRTKNDVVYEDHISPVCLPVLQELRALKPLNFILLNWDLFIGYSYALQLTRVRTLYQLDASDDYFWTEDVTDSTICVSSDGATVGTYVKFNRAWRFVQYGIHSCQQLQIGSLHHINVVFFMDWIIANMRE